MSYRIALKVTTVLAAVELLCGCGQSADDYNKEQEIWKASMSAAEGDFRGADYKKAELEYMLCLNEGKNLDKTHPLHVALAAAGLGEVFNAEGTVQNALENYELSDAEFVKAAKQDPAEYQQTSVQAHAQVLSRLSELYHKQGKEDLAQQYAKRMQAVTGTAGSAGGGT